MQANQNTRLLTARAVPVRDRAADRSAELQRILRHALGGSTPFDRAVQFLVRGTQRTGEEVEHRIEELASRLNTLLPAGRERRGGPQWDTVPG